MVRGAGMRGGLLQSPREVVFDLLRVLGEMERSVREHEEERRRSSLVPYGHIGSRDEEAWQALRSAVYFLNQAERAYQQHIAAAVKACGDVLEAQGDTKA